MTSFIDRYSLLLLTLILAFAFFTRLYRLEEPKAYVFDEVYHAVTAKLVAHNDPRAYEWWNPAPEPNTAVDWLHPPLAKYTQALGILTMGEDTFGWRISSAIFGLLVIAMTYSLTKELFESETIALTAALLASLDGLLLTQSRVAMNDIHVTFFILLALTWYTKYRKTHQTWWLWLTGVGAGLALASKWSGIFVVGVVGLFEGLAYLAAVIKKPQAFKKNHWPILFKQTLAFALIRFIVLLALPLTIYVLSYTQMFLQGKSLFCFEQREIPGQCYLEVSDNSDGTVTDRYISHFHELHKQIWWYQTTLEATHNYQSRPWQWFLNLRPVWFYVNYVGNNQIANIYAFGNPALFWLGGTAVLFTIATLIRQIKKLASALTSLNPLLFVLLSYLVVWLPWQLSPRIMFFYHYTPAVPLMSILLAYWLIQLSKTARWLTVLSLLLVVACFIIWYPHWTGLPVSTQFADQVYYLIKSWK